MEPSARPSDDATAGQLDASPASRGDLVVRNGRLSGARRALAAPLTLIGQAAGCDVRLHVDGVEPLHCAILSDAGGPLLRDLHSAAGTRVNGVAVRTHRLSSGDVIEIGPVQLGVELSELPTAERPAADLVLVERERDALRVQAAAVAAQQAALTEEEARLEQRAVALARQEGQLATHLEERQARLDEAEEQLRQHRAAVDAEAEASRAALADERKVTADQLAEAEQHRAAAARERRRLGELRRRLRKRWKRHFAAHEAALQKREAAVRAGQERLERERGRVRAFQERVNGELELGRRRLREDWQELGVAQQRLEEWRNAEQADHRRRSQERQQAERVLADEQRRWRQYHANLAREAEGLEGRIAQLRKRLDAMRRETAQESAPRTDPPPLALALTSPVDVPPAQWPARLQTLAGDLADQRAHLAEQWERLLRLQQQWQQERSLALAEVEVTAQGLQRRERQLEAAERQLAAAREELARRLEESARLREALQGWQARLTLEEADARAAADARLAQLEARERLVETRVRQIDDIHQRRHQQRRREAADAHAARARREEARRQYSALWAECERLREALCRQQRELGVRALALEQYRQELQARSDDSARAEARIDKLRRHEAAQQAEEARQLEAKRQALLTERGRLDEQATWLGEREEELTARQQALAEGERKVEALTVRSDEEEARRQQEMRRLRGQHAVAERHLRQLRDELERLARTLLEEADAPPLAQQAA